jgi:hypothetical protein
LGDKEIRIHPSMLCRSAARTNDVFSQIGRSG